MLCEIYLRNRSPSHALNDKTPYECGMAAFLQSNILDFLVPPVIPWSPKNKERSWVQGVESVFSWGTQAP